MINSLNILERNNRKISSEVASIVFFVQFVEAGHQFARRLFHRQSSLLPAHISLHPSRTEVHCENMVILQVNRQGLRELVDCRLAHSVSESVPMSGSTGVVSDGSQSGGDRNDCGTGYREGVSRSLRGSFYEKRQELLGDKNDTDSVDIKLFGESSTRSVFDREWNSPSGVVHEKVQTVLSDYFSDFGYQFIN